MGWIWVPSTKNLTITKKNDENNEKDAVTCCPIGIRYRCGQDQTPNIQIAHSSVFPGITNELTAIMGEPTIEVLIEVVQAPSL